MWVWGNRDEPWISNSPNAFPLSASVSPFLCPSNLSHLPPASSPSPVCIPHLLWSPPLSLFVSLSFYISLSLSSSPSTCLSVLFLPPGPFPSLSPTFLLLSDPPSSPAIFPCALPLHLVPLCPIPLFLLVSLPHLSVSPLLSLCGLPSITLGLSPSLALFSLFISLRICLSISLCLYPPPPTPCLSNSLSLHLGLSPFLSLVFCISVSPHHLLSFSPSPCLSDHPPSLLSLPVSGCLRVPPSPSLAPSLFLVVSISLCHLSLSLTPVRLHLPLCSSTSAPACLLRISVPPSSLLHPCIPPSILPPPLHPSSSQARPLPPLLPPPSERVNFGEGPGVPGW